MCLGVAPSHSTFEKKEFGDRSLQIESRFDQRLQIPRESSLGVELSKMVIVIRRLARASQVVT